MRSRVAIFLIAAIFTVPNVDAQRGGEGSDGVDSMRRVAESLSGNQQGYWEATIAGGHVLVHVPEGEFTMGADDGESDELPVRSVYLDEYWIGKHTVTVAQFREFVEDKDYVTDAERGKGSYLTADNVRGPNPEGNWKNNLFEQGDDHPVVSISWNDAIAYCDWLSSKTGLNVTLPTEAQWEKAARGTDGRTFPWGEDPPTETTANFADITFVETYGSERRIDPYVTEDGIRDGYAETSPVGNYADGASPYGVMDMAGNVWEWCFDYYDAAYYAVAQMRNPQGPADGGDRVNRGGSYDNWSGFGSPEGGHNLRSAERTGNEPDSSDDHMGFRIAVDYGERRP